MIDIVLYKDTLYSRQYLLLIGALRVVLILKRNKMRNIAVEHQKASTVPHSVELKAFAQSHQIFFNCISHFSSGIRV